MHEKVLGRYWRTRNENNDFLKKRMKFLTKEQKKSYENSKTGYICKEKLQNKYLKDKKYRKVRDCCHYTGEYRDTANGICNLK